MDYRALVSGGLWTEATATSDEEYCLILTRGLWDGPFGTVVAVLLALGIGRHGYCMTMD